MKDLICLRDWIHDACCNGANDKFVHGVQILTDGTKSIIHKYPFDVALYNTKFVITKDKNEFQYKISQFNQTYDQIRDLFSRCVFGEYQNTIIRKSISYIVNDGNQSTFVCPLLTGEEHLGIEYYQVFFNGQLCGVGTDELQFTLDVNGDVFFTIPIEDVTDTPDFEPPHIIDIYFYVKK